MNASDGAPQPGHWYTRWDRGELFEVMGREGTTGAVAIRTFDGRTAFIDRRAWSALPLTRAIPPAGWSAAGTRADAPQSVTPRSGRILWQESLLG